MNRRKQQGQIYESVVILIAIIFFIAIISIPLWLWPKYRVYRDTLIGQAELRRAEWNRQILIQEAKAKEEAAVSWARAEVARARGAAEANQIVGEYLGGPEAYLRWLYIEQLPEVKGQIIYLPTEAGVPILEAGKR